MEERKQKEKEIKREIYKRTKQIIDKIDEIMLEQEGTEENTRNNGLSNIGITVNNKIVELQHEFERKGLSMYIRENKELGYYQIPFLGEAILEDLFENVDRGIQTLLDYYQEAVQIVCDKEEQIQKKTNRNPIKKLISKLTGGTEIRLKEFIFTKDEIDRLSKLVKSYESINDAVWTYNLEKDVVKSIINKLEREPATKEIVESEIIPELQELGLEKLIPQLREKVKQIPEGTIDYETIILAIKEYEEAMGVKFDIPEDVDKEKIAKSFKEHLKVRIDEEFKQENDKKTQKKDKEKEDTFER